MKRGDWVTVGPEPYLATCMRCGWTLPKPPYPLQVEVVLGYMRGFIKAHADCPPREAPAPPE